MDGLTLLRDLRQHLQEQELGTWMDDKSSYDYLWRGAIEFVGRTKILTTTQTITTVAGQRAYKLNADYLQPQLFDDTNQPFVKYYNGSNYTFVRFREYDPMIIGNQTTSVSIPNTWSITDYPMENSITSSITFTSTGTLVWDESILFRTQSEGISGISAGDSVLNATDESQGIVTEVNPTLNTVVGKYLVYTKMFGGSDNTWEVGDDYKIIPQGKMQIVFDPPPSTSGHTVTVYYVQRPAPVFSGYRSYRIPINFKQALIYYAAYLYKARDREPQFGALELQMFEAEVKKACVQFGRTLNRKGFKVNFMKNATEYGSLR